MSVPSGIIGRARILGGAAFLVAAALAAASPAFAFDPDYKGWFAALDLASTQPAGLDQHFANQVTGTFPSTNVERIVIDNDAAATWMTRFGYGFGRGYGDLRFSYWTFDHDDTRNIEGGTLYATLIAPVTQGPVSASAARGTSTVKARTYDIDYLRPIMYGDKVTVSWLAGLRYATFQEDTRYEAIGTYYPGDQVKHIESRGTGIRFGMKAHFIFSSHFALEGDATFSSLRGRLDADGSQTQDFGGGPIVDSVEASESATQGQMLDLEVRTIWSYGALDYYLGYGTSSWDGLVADPLRGTATGSGSSSPGDRTRDSISFDGLHVGVIWRFRGK